MQIKIHAAVACAIGIPSLALAADMPAPHIAQPIEYVRACDAYGAGYFQIPGKDTCIKLSGYVRSWYTSHDLTKSSGVVTEAANGAELVRNDGAWSSQFYLQFETMTQSELMTIKTFAGLYSLWDGTADQSVNLDYLYLQLGLTNTDLKFGLFNSMMDPFSGYGEQYNGLPYGGRDTLQANVTVSLGNGFTAGIAVEDASYYQNAIENAVNFATAFTYDTGMMQVALMGGASAYSENGYGYGISGYVKADPFDNLSVGFGATYADSALTYLGGARESGFTDIDSASGFSLVAGLNYQLTDEVTFSITGAHTQLSQADESYDITGVSSTVYYTPVAGLTMLIDGGLWQDSNNNETATVTGRIQYDF